MPSTPDHIGTLDVCCPTLAALATAVPSNRVSQEEIAQFARTHFGPHLRDIERYMPIFSNSEIESRYLAAPVEWLGRCHTLAEKNHLYIEAVSNLCEQAARSAMRKAGLKPGDIDYIVFVNTTGIATPSIDARLINLLGLRTNIRRTPIWGLGCAGGAAALSHACHYLKGHPEEIALIVCAEFCSLTFLADDYSVSNLVATALFSDGAAAVIMCGADRDTGAGVSVLATNSRFYPDSLEVMGWNVVEAGLQVVFAQRIPSIVAKHARQDLEEFLTAQGLSLGQIDDFLFHPGGAKVLAAYAQALTPAEGRLDHSRAVLRGYGNMSSATVLFVVEKYLDRQTRTPGGYALVSALGPGFCSESTLIRS
jgi:alkylresorcinol/alkylpyrone synthase